MGNTEQERFVDALIASVRNPTTERGPLLADDGIDYRNLVLARLLDQPTKTIRTDSAQLWKQASQRLDQLGL